MANHLAACLLLLALPVAVRAAEPQTAPAPLAKELAIARKYAEYQTHDLVGTWEVAETLPTVKGDDDKWALENAQLSITDEGLQITANPSIGGYATLKDRTFKGPVGIRYEAMAPPNGLNGVICDLSCRFGPAATKDLVQFQLGAYRNTENMCIVGDDLKRALGGPLIVPGQWHTVEVTLVGNVATGKVDGKVVMNEKLPATVTDKTEHDFSFYVWSSTGTFRKARILKYIPAATAKKEWADYLGTLSEDDLRKIARSAAPFLGDDNFAKRKAAEDILANLHPLSDAVIMEQIKNPDPEARFRAERLARKVGLIEEPKAPKTQPPPQDNGPQMIDIELE